MNSEENEGEKLPDGWILCQSKSSPGRRYFFNTKTGKSSWTQPQAEDDPEQNKQKGKKEKIGIREKRKKIEAQKKTLKRKGEDEDDVLSNKKQRPESTPDSFTSPSPTKPMTPAKYLEPKPILKYTPLKPILTKNSANARLSQLRARLSNEAHSSDEVDSPSNRFMIPRTPAPFEQKTVRFDLKTPPINEFKNTVRSPTSDSLYSTPSTSQFFAANKIISSMKAHLPEQFRNFRPKDTFAEIEDGIYNHTADHPFEMKHPSTPPQFSEASKLVSAIKSKLAYTPPEHRDERKMQNRDYNDKIGNFMSNERTGFRMNSSFPPQSPMSHKNEPRYQQKEFMGTRHDQMRTFVPNKEQTSGVTTLPSNMPTFSRPTDPRQDKMRAFVANVRQLNNIENNKQKPTLPTVEHINYSEYKARNCMLNKNVNNQQPNQITDTLRTHVPNKQNIEENMRNRLAHRQQFEENFRSQNATRIEDKPRTPYTPINQERDGPRLRTSIQNRLRIGENTSTCPPNRVQLHDRLRSNSVSNVVHPSEKLKPCLVNRVHMEEKPRTYPPIRQQIEENRLKTSIETSPLRRPLTQNKVQIQERLRPPALYTDHKEKLKPVTLCNQTVEPKTGRKTPERVKPTTSIEEELEKLDQKTTPQTQNIVNHKKEEVQSSKSNQDINADTVVQNQVPVVQIQIETTISEPIKDTLVSSTLPSNQEILDVNMTIEHVKTSEPFKDSMCTVTQEQKLVCTNMLTQKQQSVCANVVTHVQKPVCSNNMVTQEQKPKCTNMVTQEQTVVCTNTVIEEQKPMCTNMVTQEPKPVCTNMVTQVQKPVEEKSVIPEQTKVISLVPYWTQEPKPVCAMVTQEQKPVTNMVTEAQKPVTNLVTQGQTPVINMVTQKQKPVNNMVTQEQKPVNNMVTQEQKPVTNMVTQELKPVTNMVTQEQKLVTNMVTQEQKPVINMVTQKQKHVEEKPASPEPTKVISLVPYCASPDIEIIDDDMESDEPDNSQDLKHRYNNEQSNEMKTLTQQHLIAQLTNSNDDLKTSKPQMSINHDIRNETITNSTQNQHSENQKFTPFSPNSEDPNKGTLDTIIIELDSDSDSLEEVQTFTSAKERMENLRNRLSKEAEEMPEITDVEFLNSIKLPSPNVNVITDEEYLNMIELPKYPSEEAMEVDCKEDLEPSLTRGNLQNMDPNADIVLVVDTNIFIHELDVIRNVLNSHIKGYTQQPTLLVPWRVITELDRLKDNNNGNGAICKRARAAMDYLYKSLPENNRIKGQSLRDSNSHIYPCETPDDEILNCCLQQQERGKSVILLSNDKNLCNKAVVNGIRCIDATDELKPLLESKPQASADPDLWATVKHCEKVMYQLLANILENEMRAKYNNLWQHVIFKAPPWSLRDVLQCLLKHWIAVFDEVFPRIEHLITDLKNTATCIGNKDLLSLTQSEVTNFKELCLEIAKKCLIIPEYMELAKATVERLQRKACEDLTEMAVIEAFERLWIVFSSYCAQLCAATGLECTVEDKLGNNMSVQELSEKWPVYSAQLYALTLAIKGSLCLNNEDLSDEQVDELEDVFKESLTFVHTDTSRVNKHNLRTFCTKCRNMLQEASTKLTSLTELLNLCKLRMDTM